MVGVSASLADEPSILNDITLDVISLDEVPDDVMENIPLPHRADPHSAVEGMHKKGASMSRGVDNYLNNDSNNSNSSQPSAANETLPGYPSAYPHTPVTSSNIPDSPADGALPGVYDGVPPPIIFPDDGVSSGNVLPEPLMPFPGGDVHNIPFPSDAVDPSGRVSAPGELPFADMPDGAPGLMDAQPNTISSPEYGIPEIEIPVPGNELPPTP